MEDRKKFEDLWTIEKNMYFIEISNGTFYIMDKKNMMLLIEDDDLYIEVIRTMIQNNVKVIKRTPKTGDEILIPAYEALQEFDSIPRKNVKVKIVWETNIPINKQLLKLKKIYEQFRQIPTVQLYKMINSQDEEWVFADIDYEEAKELLDKAECEGVKLVIETF